MNRSRIPAIPPLLLAVFLIQSTAALASESYNCGIRPFPEVGCHVGHCVDGQWEQLCPRHGGVACGLKPFPELGCRIGRCVSGKWEQVCDSRSGLACGIQPIPAPGCRIGRCIGEKWEQVCD